LTVAQLGVLRAINRGAKDGEPLSRLAETLVMDRTSLYRALGPMARSGWLLIKDAPKGHAKVVQLSKAGIRAIAGAAEYWERAQSRVIGEFGVDRWATLQKAMTDLTALGVRLGG
jgi:DNA-binding MarR family transcriptional regulator